MLRPLIGSPTSAQAMLEARPRRRELSSAAQTSSSSSGERFESAESRPEWMDLGRKRWGGTTLEWSVATPPPLENFEEIPAVTHGPYYRENLIKPEKSH